MYMYVLYIHILHGVLRRAYCIQYWYTYMYMYVLYIHILHGVLRRAYCIQYAI
jgi:hypothetical protein